MLRICRRPKGLQSRAFSVFYARLKIISLIA